MAKERIEAVNHLSTLTLQASGNANRAPHAMAGELGSP